jgi:hypothetical protein
MGYAQDIVRVLARCRRVDHRGNDQRTFELVRSLQDESIRVDVERRVFCNLSLRERHKHPPTPAPILGYNMTLDTTFVQKACSYTTFFLSDVCAFVIGLSSGVIVALTCMHSIISLHTLLLAIVVLTDMVVETALTRYSALVLLGRFM